MLDESAVRGRRGFMSQGHHALGRLRLQPQGTDVQGSGRAIEDDGRRCDVGVTANDPAVLQGPDGAGEEGDRPIVLELDLLRDTVVRRASLRDDEDPPAAG